MDIQALQLAVDGGGNVGKWESGSGSRRSEDGGRNSVQDIEASCHSPLPLKFELYPDGLREKLYCKKEWPEISLKPSAVMLVPCIFVCGHIFLRCGPQPLDCHMAFLGPSFGDLSPSATPHGVVGVAR